MNLADSLHFNHELARFFARMLGEAVHLRSDRVALVTKGEGGAELYRGKRLLKQLLFNKEWFPRIDSWMAACHPQNFAIRRKAEVLSAKLTRESDGYSFSEITTEPLEIALSELLAQESDIRSLAGTLGRSPGLVVIAGSHGEFTEAHQKLAAIIGGGKIIPLTKDNVGSALERSLADGFICGSMQAGSLQEALRKLVSLGVTPEKLNVRGFITTQDGKLAFKSALHERVDSVAVRTPTLEKEDSGDISGRSQLILVVEDDPDQRDILTLMLKSDGFEVDLARNGREALEQIKKRRPALVLTDLMMPIMDGKELLQDLKADADLESIPVMVLTAIDDETQELELLTKGAIDYCIKATQPRILLQKIRNHLR